MHPSIRPIVVVTSALVLDVVLVLAHAPTVLILMVTLSGPFLVSWLALSIFLDRSYPPRRHVHEEWQRVDRADDAGSELHTPHAPA